MIHLLLAIEYGFFFFAAMTDQNKGRDVGASRPSSHQHISRANDL